MKLQVAVTGAVLSDCAFLSFLLLHFICRNEDWSPGLAFYNLACFSEEQLSLHLMSSKDCPYYKNSFINRDGDRAYDESQRLIVYACNSLFSILLLVVYILYIYIMDISICIYPIPLMKGYKDV